MTSFSNFQLTVDNIPSVSSVQFNELHPKYRWINLPSLLPFVVIPFIPLSIVLTQFDKLVNSGYAPLCWAAMVLFAISILVLGYLRAKNRRYAIREYDMLFQQGLFWQKTTAVAFNRIQHIDLTHGPLERKYQIATLKFFTAGGGAVDLKIPGLPEQDAERIRSLILNKINQDKKPSETEEVLDNDQ